jgi:hypothetical protein
MSNGLLSVHPEIDISEWTLVNKKTTRGYIPGKTALVALNFSFITDISFKNLAQFLTLVKLFFF